MPFQEMAKFFTKINLSIYSFLIYPFYFFFYFIYLASIKFFFANVVNISEFYCDFIDNVIVNASLHLCSIAVFKLEYKKKVSCLGLSKVNLLS